MTALQLGVDSLAVSGLYAIIGIAVLVAFTGTRVLHLAIGEVGIAGALVAAALAPAWPLLLAVPAGLVVAGAASATAERILVAPLVRRIELAAVLLIAGAVVLREVLRALFAREAYAFPTLGGVLHPGGSTIRASDLLAALVAVAIAVVVTLVLRRTEAGAALRATAAGPVSAELIGVDTAVVRTAAFAVAGALAAGAMLLAASRLPLAASAGVALALKGVAAAVAGRLRSPLTVCCGALVIGTVEVVGSYLLGSGGEVISDLVALLLLVLAGLRR